MMPQARIREGGYRRYEGVRGTRGRALVIARRLVSSARKQRAVIALAILAAFPTVVTAFVLYLAGRLKPEPGDSYVYRLLTQPYGTFFIALAMAMRAGGGAVCDEARAGGFQFYFARPLTHAQYLAGKLIGVGALVAAVSMAPAMLLAIAKLAMTGGAHAVILLVKAAALGALEAAVFSSLVVLLSTLMRRRGLVQAAFAAAIFLPWIVGARFRDFTRTPWPALLSIPTHLDTLGRWLFGISNDLGDRAMPPLISLLALIAIAVGCALVTWRRLRRAEVVAG